MPTSLARVIPSTQRQLLLALLANLEAFAELPDDLAALSTHPEVAGFRVRGVPYRPNHWFRQAPTPGRRQARSRALRRLASAGLVRRITQPRRDRVTHVQFTQRGLALALALAGADADRGAVAEALRRTAWGEALLHVL